MSRFGHSVPDVDDIDIPIDEYVAWYSKITRCLVPPTLVEDETHAYRPTAHEWPSHAWHAKQQELITLFGTWEDSFEKRPKLIKALVDASSKIVVRWDTEEIDSEYIQGLCVIFVRHARIMATMKELEWSPLMAYHRVCVRHLQRNVNTKVKDYFLKKILGKVAYAKKEYKFAVEYKKLMELLKDIPDVRMWLRNINFELWSLTMDNGGMRYVNMTTNAFESFIDVLKHRRDLPISALVVFTFKQLNKYLNKRC
ncbi:hypothetical protein QQ045_011696 [Rhodiola kirilowii]